MKHLDFTIDLETCATSANAAVMQVAAVAWQRDAESEPFTLVHSGGENEDVFFNEHIDLRTCVVDGFDFDSATVQWWSGQSEAAKQAVCGGLAEPVEEVFIRLIHWMEGVVKIYKATSMCLWCQGMDFDGAILRNICRKYDLKLPCRYQQFRDSRTMILEAAVIRAGRSQSAQCPVISSQEILENDHRAYDFYQPLPHRIAQYREAHDALYDAVRTSWNTWQALKWLKG